MVTYGKYYDGTEYIQIGSIYIIKQLSRCKSEGYFYLYIEDGKNSAWDDVNIAKDIVHLELQEFRNALVPFNPIYKKPFKDYPEEQIAFTAEKDWEGAADYIISILAMQKLIK